MTDPSDARERITAKLIAFVARIAAERTCEDDPSQCESSSGPYCGAHGLGDLDRWIFDAREVQREAAALSNEPIPGSEVNADPSILSDFDGPRFREGYMKRRND